MQARAEEERKKMLENSTKNKSTERLQMEIISF